MYDEEVGQSLLTMARICGKALLDLGDLPQLFVCILLLFKCALHLIERTAARPLVGHTRDAHVDRKVKGCR